MIRRSVSAGNANCETQFDATRQHRREKYTSGCSQLFQVPELSIVSKSVNMVLNVHRNHKAY